MGGLETHENRFVELFDRLNHDARQYICMSDYYRAWIERPRNPTIVSDREHVLVDGFQDRGFRLEHVVNGPASSVYWNGAALPQVNPPSGTDEFRYPDERIRRLAHNNGLLNWKERHASKYTWYANEVCDALGLKPGYYGCRRLLARVKWLRRMKDKWQMKQ
jgi:hypothetical protein